MSDSSNKMRMLWARLSVLEDQFSREMIESICTDETISKADLPALLVELIEQSLIMVQKQSDEKFYKLPATMKLEALAEFENQDKKIDISRRFINYYVSLAQQARKEMFGPKRQTWMEYLERDQANIDVALERCVELKDAESGMLLAIGLREFWNYDRYDEGHQWLQTFLAMSHVKVDQNIRAKALDDAGALVVIERDGIAKQRRLFEQSLAIRRELGDAPSVAVSLIHLGNLALYHEQDLESAETMYTECLSIFENLDSRSGIAYGRHAFGRLALERGDYQTAKTIFSETLEIFYDLQDVWVINFSLMNFAELAVHEQKFKRALRLAGATEALRESISYKASGTYWQNREARSLNSAWDTLGREHGATAWAEGRAMSLEQSVAYALEES